MNEQLLLTVNATGKVYITHTKLDGNYTLRMVTSQTNIEQDHVDQAWNLLVRTAESLYKN
jgi:aromatic-L-amino-acid decarboxylase